MPTSYAKASTARSVPSQPLPCRLPLHMERLHRVRLPDGRFRSVDRVAVSWRARAAGPAEAFHVKQRRVSLSLSHPFASIPSGSAGDQLIKPVQAGRTPRLGASPAVLSPLRGVAQHADLALGGATVRRWFLRCRSGACSLAIAVSRETAIRVLRESDAVVGPVPKPIFDPTRGLGIRNRG
jgi:hypothetical protein